MTEPCSSCGVLVLMTRFHFHLFNGSGPAPDEQGQDLASLDEARRVAIEGIRSILSAELLEGSLDLRGHIDIADPSGQVLAVVPYAEAIRIYLPEDSR